MKNFSSLKIAINLFCVGFAAKKEAGMPLAFSPYAERNALKLFKKGQMMKRKKPNPIKPRLGANKDGLGLTRWGPPNWQRNIWEESRRPCQRRGKRPGR